MKDFTINDLCLGNKVMFEEKIYQVVGIDEMLNSITLINIDKTIAMKQNTIFVEFNKISPIQITERILTNNEWYLSKTEYTESGDDFMRQFNHNCGFFIAFYLNNFTILGTSKSAINIREVKYVHEIENIIYHTAQMEFRLFV